MNFKYSNSLNQTITQAQQRILETDQHGHLKQQINLSPITRFAAIFLVMDGEHT